MIAANVTRIEADILTTIAREEEASVPELAAALRLTPSAVQTAVARLRELELVETVATGYVRLSPAGGDASRYYAKHPNLVLPGCAKEISVPDLDQALDEAVERLNIQSNTAGQPSGTVR